MPSAKVTSVEPLSASEARWIRLNKINYVDQEGRQRTWECAERKTRGSSGIDAVAILALLRSKTNAFPLSTIIIEQYRPPIDKYIIELPAGLIDEGETPEEAAIRELREETGYKGHEVILSTPTVVCDPGMTNANMKAVVVSVLLDDTLETPESKLDEGEYIVKRVVELAKLHDELQEYDKKGFVVDARLSHFALGFAMSTQVASGNFV